MIKFLIRDLDNLISLGIAFKITLSSLPFGSFIVIHNISFWDLSEGTMKKKPIDGHYNPEKKLKLLNALVQVLLVVMIIGISIIVIIIVKEVFFSPKKNRVSNIDQLPTIIVEGDKVESIYLHGTKMYLVLETKGEDKEVRIIDLEDGIELLRQSATINQRD